MTGRRIQRVGLIGWPVAHSVSPEMHNAAFAALGFDWRYELLPAPPRGLACVVQALNAEAWRGANVTVPHKEAVIGMLDQVDGAASAIGAVNTIVARGGRLVGTNTDAAGAMGALREAGFEPAGAHALVLGAGGGARAVVYGLASAGCRVTVYNRTAPRAAALVRDMATSHVGVVAAGSLVDLDLDRFDLLVNATPAGMAPHSDASPWPEALPLPAHWTVFDLVYNPAETRLMARARAAGATVVGGLPMLVYQGALAFELWTGVPAPVQIMRRAAREALDAMREQASQG